MQEFQIFRMARNDELPKFDPNKDAAIDHFWAAMSEKVIADEAASLRYPNLSLLATRLLVLPHSNADPERVFSMVNHTKTEVCSQLSPSTTCALLTLKMNHRKPCFASRDLLTDDLLKEAKTATSRSLQNDMSDVDNA